MLYNRFVKFKKVKKWQEKRGKEKLKCIYTAQLESTSAIKKSVEKNIFCVHITGDSHQCASFVDLSCKTNICPLRND